MSSVDPKPHVSLHDVARHLGVSHTTVSLALHNSQSISEATRQRVRRAAKDMGYRPDPMLSALAHYRRSKLPPSAGTVLAWLNVWPEPKKLRSFPDFELFWQGAAEQAQRLGYRLEEFALCEIGALKRLEQILLARGIDGILLPPIPLIPWEWGDFGWDHFCVVRLSRTVFEPRVHLVTTDQVANTILSFREMQARGYERIGFFMTEHGPMPHRRHFAYGYLGAQIDLPPKQRLRIFDCPGLDAPGPFCPRPDAQRLFERWLQRERPDAIVGDWDIRPMVERAGYRIPEDIGWAGTSVSAGETHAGIYQNPREVGRVSVNLVTNLIRDNDRGIPAIFRQVLIEGRWVDGTTLPRRK